MLPNENPQTGADVSRLMAVYEKIMLRWGWETPLDEIKLHFQELSPAELDMVGQVYRALAQFKRSFAPVTPVVTRATPDRAGDGGHSVTPVTELEKGPKVPCLAILDGGKQ